MCLFLWMCNFPLFSPWYFPSKKLSWLCLSLSNLIQPESWNGVLCVQHKKKVREPLTFKIENIVRFPHASESNFYRIGEAALDCELSIQSCFKLEATKSDLGYSFYVDQEVLTAMEESRDFSNVGETIELGCMSLENHKSIHHGQWIKSGIHTLPLQH